MMKMKTKPTGLSRMNGSSAGEPAAGEWELRPGGMLVQKRDPDSDRFSPPPPTLRIRVQYGSTYHEISISSQATFGELKKMLAGPTGLHHLNQKLIYKDKERDSKAFLDIAGVKDKSKIVLLEDPISQEKRYLEMRRNAKKEKASKSVSEISLEVDKLAVKVKSAQVAFVGYQAEVNRAELLLASNSNMEAQIQTKPNHVTQLLWFYGIAACIKLLLVPSYHSTDFEVHRNWLAITHSLPLSQWYSDESSPWTLDYPPFFAFFERLLSIPANLIDPKIVHLQEGQNYSSDAVLYFQRISVILSDLSLLYGVHRLTRNLLDFKERIVIWVLIVWSPGLILVDHMHFQYNGFLLGFLLLSISYMEEDKNLIGGFWFAVLLCFKHLFAVAAPIYFVYLLRHYCWKGGLVKGFWRLCTIGTVVVAVFAAAYGPFVYYGQIQQVIHRMFPFGRGLCHAYWAPNFWVFYIILDKGLYFLFRKVGFNIQAPAASFTGGLVGDSSPFAVLPQVTPSTTFIMVLLALTPCLAKAWRDPQPRMIARWIAYAYTCGFLFGWHVHEKASLHFLIPLAIVAARSPEDARHYFLLSIVSCYSLFPLLFEAQEYPIKVVMLLLHAIVMWFAFATKFSEGIVSKETAPAEKKGKRQLGLAKGQFGIGWVEKVYLMCVLGVEIWGQVLHPLIFGDKLPFLPLMLISIYCSIGIMYSWIWQIRWIIRS